MTSRFEELFGTQQGAASRTSSPGYRLGFETLSSETVLDRLTISGRIPSWLSGTLLRTGPAKFEVGDQRYRHWFDGLAMLHRFSLRGGDVSYANRFLESRAYRAARDTGQICFREFATDPCKALFSRISSGFEPQVTDNASVNVTKIEDHFLAMTETPLPIEFDPATLETLGVYDYGDSLPDGLTTAHPHFDFGRNETFNFTTSLDPPISHNIYRLTGGNRGRRLVRSIEVDEPAYVHSFGMSERFVVFVEYPYRVNVLDLIAGGRPFIENFRWDPDAPARFLVVDKEDGALRAQFETPAFFSFHHVNAFETPTEVVVDLVAYRDPEIIQALYLDNLRSGGPIPRPEVWRYRLSLNGGSAASDRLADVALELPRINYRRCNGRPYRYVYGMGSYGGGAYLVGDDFAAQLVKLDVSRSEVGTWRESGCFPGEPVFVPEPGASNEDEGVILSVVLDSGQSSSFLLVLDAGSMTEIGRAGLPHHIPFSFHGQYFG
jgi:carotenoid cleavage dioxygenase-like enzyme